MTRWWWIRHGPTHQKAFTGWRDVAADLSDAAAIERLARALPVSASLVSSDLLRARATADAVHRGQTRLAPAPDLREFNFGAWDGLAYDQVAKRDPDLSRAFWDDPGVHCAPGGESWDDLAARVAAYVDQINDDPAPSDIVAVAHFGVILTQIARAANQSAAEVLTHRIDPLSLTVLNFDNTGWEVERINHKP